MPDPRNIAHDKTVAEEKKHDGVDISEGASVTPQPGKKPPMEKSDADSEERDEADNKTQ